MLLDISDTYLDLLLCREEMWDSMVKKALDMHQDKLSVSIYHTDWEHRDDVLMAFNDAIYEEDEVKHTREHNM